MVSINRDIGSTRTSSNHSANRPSGTTQTKDTRNFTSGNHALHSLTQNKPLSYSKSKGAHSVKGSNRFSPTEASSNKKIDGTASAVERNDAEPDDFGLSWLFAESDSMSSHQSSDRVDSPHPMANHLSHIGNIAKTSASDQASPKHQESQQILDSAKEYLDAHPEIRSPMIDTLMASLAENISKGPQHAEETHTLAMQTKDAIRESTSSELVDKMNKAGLKNIKSFLDQHPELHENPDKLISSLTQKIYGGHEDPKKINDAFRLEAIKINENKDKKNKININKSKDLLNKLEPFFKEHEKDISAEDQTSLKKISTILNNDSENDLEYGEVKEILSNLKVLFLSHIKPTTSSAQNQKNKEVSPINHLASDTQLKPPTQRPITLNNTSRPVLQSNVSRPPAAQPAKHPPLQHSASTPAFPTYQFQPYQQPLFFQEMLQSVPFLNVLLNSYMQFMQEIISTQMNLLNYQYQASFAQPSYAQTPHAARTA
ncbi:hypothetical protein [Mycoavidus sp. B2-EB]|uniref:hypothetical protein n=1 Tax=Mycoavidus sp. B2-EB TaxID=2651972 RepID=UPI001625CB14|nr:hypothetical protein [Mycoavidus sp. B2-EB]BBO59645.1 hypothetical protein MPB2EB_0769 [Mycoavidus sp. B2-EB]